MSKQTELVGLARTTTLDEVNAAYSAGALSNRNLIINGAMNVAQRGTSFSAPQNYTLDRWKSLRYISPNYTVSQQSTGGLSGFSTCARIQRNSGDTGNTAIAFNQPIEQKNCGSVIGKTVTLSFWLRVGSDFSGSPEQFRSSVAYTTSSTDIGMYYDNFYSSGTALIQAMPISNSWTYVTHTVTIPPSAKQVGIAFYSDIYGGTAGANDYYDITGVQLEVGDTATPFEHRSYGQELALCQRYFQKIGGGSYTAIGTCMSFDIISRGGTMNYAATMRAVPSFSTTDNTKFIVTDRTGYDKDTTGFMGIAAGTDSLTFYVSHEATGVTRYMHQLAVKNGYTAYVLLDAEL